MLQSEKCHQLQPRHYISEINCHLTEQTYLMFLTVELIFELILGGEHKSSIVVQYVQGK